MEMARGISIFYEFQCSLSQYTIPVCRVMLHTPLCQKKLYFHRGKDFIPSRQNRHMLFILHPTAVSLFKTKYS